MHRSSFFFLFSGACAKGPQRHQERPKGWTYVLQKRWPGKLAGSVHDYGRLNRSGNLHRCSDAAVRRMPVIAMTAKTTIGEDAARPTPLVYRDVGAENRWVVELRETQVASEPTSFTGPNACFAALEFAHRTYGCARYLAS